MKISFYALFIKQLNIFIQIDPGRTEMNTVFTCMNAVPLIL